ncbi:hypothetical protein Pmani_025013 [Petrolisthes manimaculis]|uniref:Uncharacterized protein n=1 Tax=Petrolisthes manimaculis TaxID=1843537 RepID=A0AAE1P6D6_9EUCA|nr:hypothetical protein Pmani_025013 [Petrolisthes manimaculis]
MVVVVEVLTSDEAMEVCGVVDKMVVVVVEVLTSDEAMDGDEKFMLKVVVMAISVYQRGQTVHRRDSGRIKIIKVLSTDWRLLTFPRQARKQRQDFRVVVRKRGTTHSFHPPPVHSFTPTIPNLPYLPSLITCPVPISLSCAPHFIFLSSTTTRIPVSYTIDTNFSTS